MNLMKYSPNPCFLLLLLFIRSVVSNSLWPHGVHVWGMYGSGKDCLILIPFRLLQSSCLTLSLKCFSSDSDNCPSVGIGHLPQFRHPLRAGPVLLTFLFFPLVPLFYQVLHGSMYSFPLVRSSCPLSVSAFTSVSEDVFLMYPWRKMDSTSTCSFTILFSPPKYRQFWHMLQHGET